MWLLRIVIGAVAVVSLAIALAPEPPARAMPGVRMNVLAGEPGATPLAGFVERDASIPAGMRADPAATLVRSWTPENGVAPLVRMAADERRQRQGEAVRCVWDRRRHLPVRAPPRRDG